MSDPKSSYGEPVEEPNGVDDVVGRANEGLADAEAARRDAVASDTAPADAPISATDPMTAWCPTGPPRPTSTPRR